ncbi:hypothetical protein ABVK25_009908 [Lepraria finkii]|uniref:Zn(2)-C6 fungal-type domain-containing protein n=1 Tax=Lepraria finkii TaxID=1340010 RepID=A0ABR4AVW9_9LECA
MTQPTSYPSPHATHEDIHPFYNTNQHHMPPAEHSHIPPPAAAPMHGGGGHARDFAQGNQNGQNMRQPQPSTPQQLAQRGLEADQSQDPNNLDSSSRKRSKVSRACDECRRKKIRCDAESETPGTQCSACRRSGQVCDFSRAPQKRGPSKGYIKELAERVNLLEYNRNWSGTTPPEMHYAPIIQEQPGDYPQPPPNDYGSRKRTYDIVEGPPYLQ